MSLASTTRTIKFIAKSGTYTAMIMCSDGDLYQEYEGEGDNILNIFPDFKTLKPKLNFVCMSSRQAEGLASPEGMEYYVGNTKIEFNGVDSIGVFSGVFKKFSPSGNNQYNGLQIVDNLVTRIGKAPVTIKMVAHISYATQSDTIQATYTIPIQKSTGTGYRVTITTTDTENPFVITKKGDSCVLKAMAYQNHQEITSGLTYKWEKLSKGAWEVISGQTSQTITVAETDIDTYGEFRVTVYLSGTEIGKDIQGVMDTSDPYDIEPNPYPADECITEDESGNDKVTYTPKIVYRSTGNVAIEDAKFYFVLRNAVGLLLRPVSESNTPYTSYEVKREDCINGGGSDISIVIEAKDI